MTYKWKNEKSIAKPKMKKVENFQFYCILKLKNSKKMIFLKNDLGTILVPAMGFAWDATEDKLSCQWWTVYNF